MRRGEEGDSQPIVNDWRETWMVPSQERVVPELKHG
jgi:hypothetical protein